MEWFISADGIALGAAVTTSHTDIEMIVFTAIMLHKVGISIAYMFNQRGMTKYQFPIKCFGIIFFIFVFIIFFFFCGNGNFVILLIFR